MAAVFNEVQIGWKGQVYQIKPTMALLNRVEQSVSLTDLARSLTEGAPKLSHVATAVTVFLQNAGAVVTAEEVYQELIHGDKSSIVGMAQAIVIAAFPAPKQGNAASPKKAK